MWTTLYPLPQSINSVLYILSIYPFLLPVLMYNAVPFDRCVFRTYSIIHATFALVQGYYTKSLRHLSFIFLAKSTLKKIKFMYKLSWTNNSLLDNLSMIYLDSSKNFFFVLKCPCFPPPIQSYPIIIRIQVNTI